MLNERCRELRNAILYIIGSIFLFVISSLLIGVNIFISTEILRTAPILVFSVGMIMVLIGIVYSAMDVVNSYRVTEIEVKGEI